MNYRIISMDFDGTLLTSDKNVTEESKKILMKLKEKNYIIVGITARNLTSVKNVCDINMFNYLILNNGSSIYNVQNQKKIEMGNIDEKSIEKMTNYFENIAEEIDYCSLNKYYIYKNGTSKNKKYQIHINSLNEIEEAIARINVFFKSNQEIYRCRDYVNYNFNNLIAFEMLDTDDGKNKKWLAINPKNVNKYNALERLCLTLNVSIDEVIFFGDSTNDLPLISKVGLGVAMGNALEEVKNQAKEITLSNDKNGIARFLEKLNISINQNE